MPSCRARRAAAPNSLVSTVYVPAGRSCTTTGMVIVEPLRSTVTWTVLPGVSLRSATSRSELLFTSLLSILMMMSPCLRPALLAGEFALDHPAQWEKRDGFGT